VKFGATPLEYRHRPPTIGEHNRDIYAGLLGMSDAELAQLRERGII